MREIGRKGGMQGGKARAKSLTAEQRAKSRARRRKSGGVNRTGRSPNNAQIKEPTNGLCVQLSLLALATPQDVVFPMPSPDIQNLLDKLSLDKGILDDEIDEQRAKLTALEAELADVTRKIDAVSLTASLLPSSAHAKPAQAPTPSSTPTPSERPAHGDVDAAVRLAVAGLSEEFTTVTVENNVEPGGVFRPASIRSVLRRMEARNEIFVKKRGEGRRPTLYTKTKPPITTISTEQSL
jgi:hypothetical protein